MAEPVVKDLAKLLEGLRLVGESVEYAVTVSDPPPPAASMDAAALLRQQKEDLAWLTAQTRLLENLQGTYVALYHRAIVCTGPSDELVRMGAAERLEIRPEDVLVVPISVPGDDSWDGLKARFGIESGY
ncbi:MAG: hypothetical protein G01um1014106_300 [Parcubacteria group bacterium Gr01-1014_106]|nr:MAG: hypothetical protein G01um1014106_300 [Parcubacteria group bacterium Gr01-1014_106]